MNERIQSIFAEIQATLRDIRADSSESNRHAAIMSKNIWNISELALYLGCTTDRASRMAKQRLFPSYKQNGHYYFRRSEIEAWQTTNRTPSLDELNARAAIITAKKHLH